MQFLWLITLLIGVIITVFSRLQNNNYDLAYLGAILLGFAIAVGFVSYYYEKHYSLKVEQ